MVDAQLPVHLLVPHHGQQSILVDASDVGRLPVTVVELRSGDTVVTAMQRHLRREWDLGPVLLEVHLPPPPTPDEGYRGLTVLDAPPIEWTPPPGLKWGPAAEPAIPQRIAARARAWLGEWRSTTDPPPLRPRWSRPGWHARATGWIADQLEGVGREPAAEIEIRRLWGISALLRIPTSDGEAWFKAVFPHFHHEPAVTALLADLRPGVVPPVIATQPDEGWLLMETAGSPLRDDADADAGVLRAMASLGDVQDATHHLHGLLESLGCPRRPLSELAAELRQAVDEAEDLGGHRVSGARAARVVEWVAAGAEWLDGLGLPDVLVHGDFHPGNVLRGSMGLAIADWSDAAIAHPVMEIAPWFGEVRPELRPAGWEAWLRALARFGDVEALRPHEQDAYALACAYQVVSYAGILRGMEPANRYQVSDGFRGYWQDLDARVP